MITDPDLLTRSTEGSGGTPDGEVYFDLTTKKIELIIYGNLDETGVTLQAVYSFCKDMWKQESDLIKYPFPMLAITEEKFEMISGWDFEITYDTLKLIRTGGWALNPAGTIQEEYAGIISLGSIGTGQAYYQQVSAATSTNFVLTGAVNQAVKIYGDAEHGNFNYRSYFKIFCREYARTYEGSSIGDIGVTTMTYQVYRFPLADAADLKIVVTDANLIGETPYFETATLSRTDGVVTIDDPTITSATGGFISGDVGKYICIKSGSNKGFYKIITYTDTNNVDVERNFLAAQSSITFTVNPIGMGIDWYTTNQTRTIGGIDYYFRAMIDGNQGTAEQIYTFVQYQLRQKNDIDNQATSKIGNVTSLLLSFVGDSLYTLRWTTGEGTYIDDHKEIDRTRLYFLPNTGIYVQFPYGAILTLNFGDNLKSDAAAIYRVFFTNDDAGTNEGRDYGTINAMLVNAFKSVATTFRARASNVATITTVAVHELSVGDGVNITGLGGTGYNGNWIVASVPTSTTFTYANTGADEASTADTGGTITKQMAGKVNGASSIQFSFDYDYNVQRGQTPPNSPPEDDAPLTVVAIGLSTSQFVLATGTIERTLTNVVALVSALERNYLE